jgi:FkbM family methyltransferase
MKIIKAIKNKLKFFLERQSLKLIGGYFIEVEDSIAHRPLRLFLRRDSFMESEILKHGLYGKWEKESLRIWSHLSSRARVILDVGSNTGIYSLLALNNNSQSKVLSIEPVPVNFEVLVKNIIANGHQPCAEMVALSDKEGVAKMFMLKDRLNYMTSVNENRYALHPEIAGNHEIVEIEVPIVTYSSLAEKHHITKVDLIKIDVEGHELAVIKSMLPMIKKDLPIILLEVIGDENANELSKIFDKLGYNYISIDESNPGRVVSRLTDNDHHNFIICDQSTIDFLRIKGLVT